MVDQLKTEIQTLAQTRLAWFIAGLAAAQGNMQDVLHSITKFAGF